MQTEMIRGPSMRRDAWWLEPLPTVLLLGGFLIYATWAALANADYFAEPYLSPFYSPCLAANCDHVSVRLFGSWYTITPALLILWVPAGFRMTCYYYRKAYYRSFYGAPPACAVRDMHKRYTGERRFPLVFQNLHRYFFWLVWPVLFFLWWDVVEAFDFPDGIGVGVGTLVLLANSALLTTYSLSCHSCRHLAGGGLDVLTARPRRLRMWRFVTKLNERHAQIAWVSLVGVMLADLYVRLVATGTIRDLRLF